MVDAEGTIVLVPGAHRLKLSVSKAGTTILFGEAEALFDAQAGLTYRIHGEIRYGTAHVWVVDEQTDLIVARGSQKIANTGGP